MCTQKRREKPPNLLFFPSSLSICPSPSLLLPSECSDASLPCSNLVPFSVDLPLLPVSVSICPSPLFNLLVDGYLDAHHCGFMSVLFAVDGIPIRVDLPPLSCSSGPPFFTRPELPQQSFSYGPQYPFRFAPSVMLGPAIWCFTSTILIRLVIQCKTRKLLLPQPPL